MSRTFALHGKFCRKTLEEMDKCLVEPYKWDNFFRITTGKAGAYFGKIPIKNANNRGAWFNGYTGVATAYWKTDPEDENTCLIEVHTLGDDIISHISFGDE